MTTSTSLVKDRWWGTFGRLLLLGVIIWFVSLAFQITGNIAGTAVPFTNVATDPATGEVTVDGEPISEDEPLVVDDLLPGTVALVVAGLFTALSQGVTQALSVSGVTGLYRRAGGPADAGT